MHTIKFYSESQQNIGNEPNSVLPKCNIRFRHVPPNPTFLLNSSLEHSSSRLTLKVQANCPPKGQYLTHTTLLSFNKRLIPQENSELSVQSFIISEVTSQSLRISERQYQMFSLNLCSLLKKVPWVSFTADREAGCLEVQCRWMTSEQSVLIAGPL